LFEYAMHPQQYEAYKSGKAKADFEADLAKKKAPKQEEVTVAAPMMAQPKTLNVDVNGEKFRVSISYDGQEEAPASATQNASPSVAPPAASGPSNNILAPLEGKVYMTKDAGEKEIKVGDKISKGDIVLYIEAMKVTNAIKSEFDGVITEILVKEGDDVYDDDVIVKLS